MKKGLINSVSNASSVPALYRRGTMKISKEELLEEANQAYQTNLNNEDSNPEEIAFHR